MNLEGLEKTIHDLLDIEIYSASKILKSEECTEPDKNIAIAYQMAINRAKSLVSICIKKKLRL